VDQLFYPKSVAVIGVSDKPDNLAANIVQNLIEFQFQGDVYPIGKHEGSLFGKPIYTSLEEIPAPIDVAIILTPASTVPAILEACGRRQIPWAIIETGGFREYSEKGADLESEILRIARQYSIRVVGPNGIGLFNMENKFLVPFLRLRKDVVHRGKVSVLSQSGGVVLTYLNLLSSANVGIAKMVSMGNKLDLDEVDYLQYLAEDPETEIIGIYVESLKRGRELMDLALSTSKPIIIQKANTGEVSHQIARLHTAALANDDKIVEAALHQSNIIRARNFRSFVSTTKILSLPPMRGNNLVVLSRSGGIAIVAADLAEKYGFHLVPFSKPFQEEIHSYFRAKVIQPTNPLDLGDLFDFDLYTRILEAVLKIDGVDGVLFQHGSTGMDEEPSRQLIQAVRELSFQYEKPIALCYLTGEDELAYIKRAIDYPIFAEPEEGLSGLAVSRDHHLRKHLPKEPPSPYSVDTEKVQKYLIQAHRERRDLLLPEALEVLKAYGIAVPEGRIVSSRNDLKKTLRAMGKPVALKISSSQVSHKSDVGGVFLNLNTVAEAERAFGRLMEIRKEAPFEIYAQKMVFHGREVILGAKRDPSFGPILVFGLGGIYTEVFQETSIRVAPINRRDAKEMIAESKASVLLKGVRGQRASDREAVVESLLRLSQLMMDFPEIEGIDINPLMVLEKGAVAVDARIVLRSIPTDKTG
jgi:acyl-CoA synthetase (NDP forming)